MKTKRISTVKTYLYHWVILMMYLIALIFLTGKTLKASSYLLLYGSVTPTVQAELTTTNGNSTTTRSDGTFSMVHKPGTFTLTVEADGYETYTTNIDATLSEYHEINILLTPLLVTNRTPKAIIVAGGGPFPENNIWEATKMCANLAYEALIRQGYTYGKRKAVREKRVQQISEDTHSDLKGYTRDNIYYLSGDNAVNSNVSAEATNSNLQYAITSWATDAENLLIYLVGHGGKESFRMNGTEILYAEEFGEWLDTIQEIIPGKLIVIYDFCQAGSFIQPLLSPEGKERVVVASTTETEDALFAVQGTLSFSYFFWSRMLFGDSFYESFYNAKQSISLVYQQQNPQLDANGNGIENEREDYDIAMTVQLGNESLSGNDIPLIGSVSPTQTLEGETSALMYAEDVTDSDGIGRVWAIITPPDYSSDTLATDLPFFDLEPVGNKRYEAAYDQFETGGTYQITIFASDTKNAVSLPKTTIVTVINERVPKAIIIAGGGPYPGDNGVWESTRYLAGYAHKLLEEQGYSKETIRYLSYDYRSGVSDIINDDATNDNFRNAVRLWAADASELFIYMVDHGGSNGTFLMNGIPEPDQYQTLHAIELDLWLDEIQSIIPGKVIVVYDACYSGSFIPHLSPPSEKKRIVITSTAADQRALFDVNGMLSFSSFFWQGIYMGHSLFKSYLDAKDSIGLTYQQIPQLDGNGNGKGDESEDYDFARKSKVGEENIFGSVPPQIYEVSVNNEVSDITLENETSVIIYADLYSMDIYESDVWAFVKPPEHSVDFSDGPVTDLPAVKLRKVDNYSYEGSYSSFYTKGTYQIVVIAKNSEGLYSNPSMPIIVEQTINYDWVKINGTVMNNDDIPLCAMVLANGQHMFSCGGEGKYEFDIPLDENREITLFAFCDGHAPFKKILKPYQADDFEINMTPAPADSPIIKLTSSVELLDSGYAKITGKVTDEYGTPLCAMVLANGKHMFSCAPDGDYELEVPLDANGEITVFVFCDGFQPFKEILKP